MHVLLQTLLPHHPAYIEGVAAAMRGPAEYMQRRLSLWQAAPQPFQTSAPCKHQQAHHDLCRMLTANVQAGLLFYSAHHNSVIDHQTSTQFAKAFFLPALQKGPEWWRA